MNEDNPSILLKNNAATKPAPTAAHTPTFIQVSRSSSKRLLTDKDDFDLHNKTGKAKINAKQIVNKQKQIVPDRPTAVAVTPEIKNSKHESAGAKHTDNGLSFLNPA